MALPRHLQDTFSPQEQSFIAEETLIDIIPRQKLVSIDLISTQVPALIPPRPTTVPLWLALLLKRQHRAQIVPPSWMDEHTLKGFLDAETASAHAGFANLPFRWLEVAMTILDRAEDDLGDSAPSVRRLIRDLREVRQAKTRDGTEAINESHVQMDGLGAMEINEIRFLAYGMHWLRRIASAGQE